MVRGGHAMILGLFEYLYYLEFGLIDPMHCGLVAKKISLLHLVATISR